MQKTCSVASKGEIETTNAKYQVSQAKEIEKDLGTPKLDTQGEDDDKAKSLSN